MRKKQKVKDIIDNVLDNDTLTKNVVVNEHNGTDVAVVVQKNNENITVNVAPKEDIIVDTKPSEMTKKEKIASTIWTIINLATNIAFLFFFNDVLSGITYTNGLGYAFTSERIIGLILFAIAQISGVILFVKFFARQKLRTKLILATMPLTLLVLCGGWITLNIDNFMGETELAIKQSLNLQNFDPSTIDFKYVIIASLIYLLLLYIIFGKIVKSTKKQVQISKTNKK